MLSVVILNSDSSRPSGRQFSFWGGKGERKIIYIYHNSLTLATSEWTSDLHFDH